MKLFKLYVFVLISTLALHASGAAVPGGADVAADDLIPETWNCHQYFTRKSEVDPGFRTEVREGGFGGETLLFGCSCLEEAQFLLDAGVDPALTTAEGRSCLVWQDDLEVVRLLVSRGANPHQVWNYGTPNLCEKPINRAINLGVVRFYVEECGVDPREGTLIRHTTTGETQPHFSVLSTAYGSYEKLEYLFSVGADPNEALYAFRSAGEDADLTVYSTATISYILGVCTHTREYCDIIVPDETAATYPPASSVVRDILLFARHGADFAARDVDGRTPAHVAYTKFAVNALAKVGAPLDEADTSGRTPLFTFIEEWRRAKTDVDSGRSPLYRNALEMFKDASEALILHGVSTSAGFRSVADSGMFTEEELADVIKRRDALAVIRKLVRRTRA